MDDGRKRIEEMMALGRRVADFVRLNVSDVNWLLTMNTRNRDSKPVTISEISKDVLSLFWEPTGQGVGIGLDRVLQDGQNRLLGIQDALLKSPVGTTVEILVVCGLSRRAQEVVDTGRPRTLPDTGKLSGIDLTIAHAAALRGMFALRRQRVFQGTSRTRLLHLADQHLEALSFGVDATRSFTIKAPLGLLAGLLARASYSEDKGVLKRFAEIVGDETVVFSPSEIGAVLLRRYLTGDRRKRGGSGVAETYRYTERAMRAFLDGEELKLLKPPKTSAELFPLPGEDDGA